MARTKDDIVDAAIDILNRVGVDGLSMRTLAKALDVKAAALYWHFTDKQELFCAIAERLCGQMNLHADALPPKAYLTAAHSAYHAMLLTVRDSPVIFEHSTPVTPKRVGIIRNISRKLLEMGVTRENLMTVSNMLNNYVLSFSADEMRFKNITPEMKRSFAEMLNPETEFMFMSDRDFDEQFLYGLEIIFDGIESKIYQARSDEGALQ